MSVRTTTWDDAASQLQALADAALEASTGLDDHTAGVAAQSRYDWLRGVCYGARMAGAESYGESRAAAYAVEFARLQYVKTMRDVQAAKAKVS